MSWLFPTCAVTGEAFRRFLNKASRLPELKGIGEYKKKFKTIRFLSPEGWNRITTCRCDHTGEPMSVFDNRVSKLKRLESVGHYKAEYDSYKHLSPEGWDQIISRQCSKQGESITIFSNQREKLMDLLKSCGLPTQDYDQVPYLCHRCFELEKPYTCEVCQKPYLRRDNCAWEYKFRDDVQKWRPLDLPETLTQLCNVCFGRCLQQLTAFPATDREFLGFVSSANFPHRGIVKELGEVQHEGRDCRSPEALKPKMRIEAVRRGANAVTEFFYERHHEEETYQAGEGPAGNPYYRTKHTIWYTGRGKAVWVVPLEE
jgi:hypothetical protein